MLFDIFSNPNVLVAYLLAIPGVLLALSVHECAHGWVSYRLGDPTARNLGRLTLNPLKHIDILGLICMVLFSFGWAKPVPVNARYYKKPRRDMALVAAAGPISNLLMCIIGMLLLYLSYLIYSLTAADPVAFSDLWNAAMFNWPAYLGAEVLSARLMYLLFVFLLQFSILNISLAVFNLLPIPPLDGSRIAYIFLPSKWYFGIMRYERYIMIALFILLWLGAFSNILSIISGSLLSGINWLIRLLPFFRFP